MQNTRVAILCAHPLFGEGIASLLRSHEGLQPLPIDLHTGDAWEQLRSFRPDAIVLETPEESWVWERLRGLGPCLYICVRLGDNAAQVYRDRQIIFAQPEEIIAAIEQGTSGAAPSGDR